jgi:hypothetical protein
MSSTSSYADILARLAATLDAPRGKLHDDADLHDRLKAAAQTPLPNPKVSHSAPKVSHSAQRSLTTPVKSKPFTLGDIDARILNDLIPIQPPSIKTLADLVKFILRIPSTEQYSGTLGATALNKALTTDRTTASNLLNDYFLSNAFKKDFNDIQEILGLKPTSTKTPKHARERLIETKLVPFVLDALQQASSILGADSLLRDGVFSTALTPPVLKLLLTQLIQTDIPTEPQIADDLYNNLVGRLRTSSEDMSVAPLSTSRTSEKKTSGLKISYTVEIPLPKIVEAAISSGYLVHGENYFLLDSKLTARSVACILQASYTDHCKNVEKLILDSLASS